MRLWTHVAAELVVGLALLSTSGLAVFVGWQWVAERLESEAVAKAAPSARGLDDDVTELGLAAPVGLFHGVADDILLAPIRTGAIEDIKYNRGGSSISLRIDFDNGARAAFKPAQTIGHTVPRYEVAAFRVNRVLGLSSVPPATGRRLPVADLLGKLRSDSRVFAPRMREEMIIEDGMVAGELSWWIPVIRIPTVGGYLIDSVEGIVTWTRYLTIGQPIDQNDRALVRQVSDLVLFDFFIDNVDRWSGSNVRMSEDGRVLYFMDNTASFGTGRPGSGRTRAYLYKVQKFSRSLVAALRELDEAQVRAALTPEGDAFSELLSDDEIEALLARRQFVLDYVDNLISTHGREAVMVFP